MDHSQTSCHVRKISPFLVIYANILKFLLHGTKHNPNMQPYQAKARSWRSLLDALWSVRFSPYPLNGKMLNQSGAWIYILEKSPGSLAKNAPGDGKCLQDWKWRLREGE